MYLSSDQPSAVPSSYQPAFGQPINQQSVQPAPAQPAEAAPAQDPTTKLLEMKKLLANYNGKENVTLEDIIEFHVQFERIHPFQDGNGRIGRLIMFKECLKHNIVPFIIEDKIKMFYYRGLKEWNQEKGYLADTCLSAQDTFKHYLDYFRIHY